MKKVVFIKKDGFEILGVIGNYRHNQLQEVVEELIAEGNDVDVAVSWCSMTNEHSIRILWMIRNMSNEALQKITYEDFVRMANK